MAHHPDFVRFSDAFRNESFEEALGLVDALIAAHPRAAALRWHRANCLEKLERFDAVKAELDALLTLKPDYVPAIVKRVRYAEADLNDADDTDDEELSEAEQALHDKLAAERALAASLHAESELRRALSLQPDDVDALHLLSDVLQYREDADALAEEAAALLDRAIDLAPQRVELLETRASRHRSAAMRFDDGPEDADTVSSFSGMRYSRSALQAALADHERCFALDRHYRHAVRMGILLHDLGRFDEALLRFDDALALMPADDPAREFIVETRSRSENHGAGEREEMARLLESSILEDGKDRSLQDDMAAQSLLGAAAAIRAGRRVDEALDSRISDDPDTMMAMGIAQQILNVAHEPPPQLEEVDAKDYPGYMRSFVDRVGRRAAVQGLRTIADGEAKGLFPMLGQHVLIRFFADNSAEVGLAAFAFKPKWPGWLGFLILLLTGKWKLTSMVECVTQFDDGTHISTQHMSPSVFGYGGQVQIELLPKSSSVEDLLTRHLQRVAAHKQAAPASVALVADDLDGMDRRWRASQHVKRAYRASIGYITESELKQLLGSHHARFADKVREQVALLAADYVLESAQ